MSESILNKRSPLRPDLPRLTKERSAIFSFDNKPGMPDEVVRNSIEQHPILAEVSYDQMRDLAGECVDEIERLHNVSDIIKDPPLDVDVIWVIGAPGLLLEHGSKPGWSANFPWMDDLEWENFGSAFALETAIVARRLGKSVDLVTRTDVLEAGPWLIYNDPAYEPVLTILEESVGIPIPLDRTLIYGQFTDKEGNLREIKNTADQVDSIRMPEGFIPRRIAICVLAAQWVRLGRLLAKAKALPDQSGVLVVPTPSPAGHEREHAIMECQGAVINAFKNGNGQKNPIDYQTS